ncbi:hypothetical protein DE146DRAFT_758153 [Phaeosphaeria sp. MPI-PUGE-AT-0046c]|nr:hypothetical protein DE146DRAFT_758153 [Phaeosphaeria sp. MPI-PUGE-AT-0046c]
MSETADPELECSGPSKLTSQSTLQSPAASTETQRTTLVTRQLAQEIEADREFQEWVRIYQNADGTKREVLLQTSQSIVKYVDPAVFVFRKSYIRDPTPFRLMDLPIELRLRIAEFALASEEPLEWYWSTYEDDKRVGSFKDLDRVTGLARACRQLYTDISSFVWKVNVLRFGKYCLGEACYDSRLGLAGNHDKVETSRFLYVYEASHFFLRNISSTCLKQVRGLTFKVGMPYEEPLTSEVFQSIARISKMIPSAKIRLEVINWFHMGKMQLHRQWALPSKSTLRFMTRARQIEASLAAIDFQTEKRNWRIYPNSITRPEFLEDELEGDELQTALRWCTEGI